MPEIIRKFKVVGQCIYADSYDKVASDIRNYLKAEFEFTGWDDIANKTAVFTGPDGTAHHMLIEDNRCVIPHEVIKAPQFTVSVFGGDLMTANMAAVYVEQSGYKDGITPPVPTPDVYDQLVQLVQTERTGAEAARDESEINANQTGADREVVEELAGQVHEDAGQVAADKLIVISERQLAEIAAIAAQAARDQAQQALFDLLAMLGTDIATLTNGKLTPSQIPAIAVTDTFVVASEAAMLALNAQTGDVCIRSDEAKTYILQGTNPAALTDWQRLQSPTNYADEAGHAATADNAANADRINNKRMVGMTQAQYEAAVKDADTFYLTTAG